MGSGPGAGPEPEPEPGPPHPLPPWRKILYEPQPWPDNYTSPDFLDKLVINDAVPVRSYARVVLQACPVLEQFATVVWVGALTHNLYTGALAAWGLLVRCLALALGGWVLTHALSPAPGPFPASPWRAVGAMVQLSLAAALMSPLYATLTLTVSPDTVLACAMGLAAAHLYLADYAGAAGPAGSVRGGLSVAAALAASILVAGRLRGVADVAAQLLLSLLAFVLAPYGREAVGAAGRLPRVGLTLGMLGGAGATLSTLGTAPLALFLASCIFLGALCPLWLVRAHKFKAKINGPWDEAVPDLMGGRCERGVIKSAALMNPPLPCREQRAGGGGVVCPCAQRTAQS